jgi:hypothetical protein
VQLKCPGCSRTLKIPETAAGKVVKCPCGKQLRAPGGAAASSTAQAAPKKSATRPTAANQADSGSPSAFGVDEDFFNELTEGDLQPVTVSQSPQAPANPGSSQNNAETSQSQGKKRPWNKKKAGAIVCFVLAVLGVVAAIIALVRRENRPEGVAGMIAYAVAAFLLPIAFLIGGLVLLKKSRKS